MTIKVTRLRTFSTPWKQKLKISTCCLWNSIKPGAGEYTGPAARIVGKSLIPNDGGDVDLHTCVIDQAWGQSGWILTKFFFVWLCIRQIQLRPAPGEHLPTFSVPGVGHYQILRGPGVRHLPTPSFWQIGSSIKDAKNVWRFLEGWFLDLCMHFFIASRQNLHYEIGSYL